MVEMQAGTGEARQLRARDGTVLRYEVAGAGPPVLFLHGSFVGRNVFSRQTSLSAVFRVIFRDLRGHNGCEAIVPSDYGFATTELDDLFAVMDAEGIERADLVGHSTGGAIAVAAGVHRPERVRRMVLLEPTLLNLLPADLLARQRQDRGVAFDVEQREGSLAALRASLDLLFPPGWSARLKPEQLAQIEAAAPMCTAHFQAMFALPVTADDLRRLASPSLFLYGGRSFDYEAAIAAQLRRLRPDLPQLRIEDAGHNLHQQRSDQVNAAIRDFLIAP